RPGPAMGRVGLKATAKGGMDTVALDADAALAGGAFRLAGKIDTPATAPKFDLTLALQHPDLVRFVSAFDPGFAPANRQLGNLKIDAALRGDADNLAIEGLEGNVGPTTLSGKGTYRAAEPRPALDLALIAGTIPLGDFLGRKPVPGGQATSPRAPGSAPSPAPGVPAQGASAGGQGDGQAAGTDAGGSARWSREPVDLGALGLVDANIDLGAEAVIYDTYRVDNPKILAVLKDRVLDIRQVSGRMFEGGFAATGVVDGSDVPAFRTSVQVDKAKIRKPFFGSESFDIQAGDLSQSLTLAARGRSEYDMIRTLNGSGNLSVTDGTISGIDLAQISQSLRGDNAFANIAGLIGAIQGAIGGGKTTAVKSFAGSYTVKDGVVETTDLALVSDQSDAKAAGTVNLPAWNMDMAADITLNKLKDNPTFRVRATGAPDRPNYNFDVGSLARQAVGQGVDKLLEKVLPGGRSGEGAPTDGKPDPADAIRGLLRGLGR
ncbi:MAG: AsmA-like C-terminal region-containing protein, partial [Rhodospirillaceae bacterium]